MRHKLRARLFPVFYRHGCVAGVFEHDDQNRSKGLYVSSQTEKGWEDRHFIGHYRAVLPDEVVSLAVSVGFTNVRIRAPEETRFYQPVVTALRA